MSFTFVKSYRHRPPPRREISVLGVWEKKYKTRGEKKGENVKDKLRNEEKWKLKIPNNCRRGKNFRKSVRE
jgi:hypothetical protein